MNHFTRRCGTRALLKCCTAVGLSMSLMCASPIMLQDNVKPAKVVYAADFNSQQKVHPGTISTIAGSAIFESGVFTEIVEDTQEVMTGSTFGFESTLENVEDRADFTPAIEITSESTPYSEKSTVTAQSNSSSLSIGELNAYSGTIQGPSGKETYYNLPMDGVVKIMRDMGYSEEEYPYWVREDGVKMFGPYVMAAASLDIRPKGTILECSKGTAMVVDTGDFAETNQMQLDIATDW